MRYKSILAITIICLMGISVVYAEPTAKTYIFAASGYMFQGSALDSLAKHFDVIISHDPQRGSNPILRDTNEVPWRRDKAPTLLVYKDAMTLIGPRDVPYPPYHYNADSTLGGGASVGGFWHFDTLLKQNFPIDTFFMLATYWTDSAGGHYDTVIIGNDTIHRVHAGSVPTWQWRWAMDYGDSYWQGFYSCSTKVQCLRNYTDTTYDDTYFDGIFMDNLLQYVNNMGYRMFPMQYMNGDTVDSIAFRSAVHSFSQTVGAEYHNSQTPPGQGSQILGVANLNNTYRTPAYDSIWRTNVNILDGGMEESFVTMGCSFTDWYKFLYEISIAESLGKTCLMCHKVDSFAWTGHMPFDYTEFDSTDLMYGFTSYLMAFDSLACFYFTPKDSQHYTFVCRAPIIDIDLGKPMEFRILKEDNLAYRHYEEGVAFVNATDNQLTAGFSGDTLLRLDAKAEVTSTVVQFTLPADSGAICLYAPNYFHGSGFEPSDRLCWENYCLEVEGITDCSAERVTGDPPNPVIAHSGDWMYRVKGTVVSGNTSLVRFKVFPYDIPIQDSTYFSFWIYVDSAPGDSASIGLDC